MAMNNPADTFWAPETIELPNGKIATALPLDMDDLAAWANEIHAVRKAEQMKLIPTGITVLDRFKVLRTIEFNKPVLDDIADLLYTPAGIKDCVVKSLIKAGMDRDSAKSTASLIKPNKQQKLAHRLCGLFDPAVPETPTAEEAPADVVGKPIHPSTSSPSDVVG